MRKRRLILNPLRQRLLAEVVEAREAIVAGGGAQLLCWIPTSKNNPLSQVEEEEADTKLRLLAEVVEARKAIVAGGGAELLSAF